MRHLRFLQLLGYMVIVVSIAACESILPNSTTSASPTPSYSLGSLRLGDSVIRQRTSPYRVRNCQGTNNPLRVSSGYSLSNAVEWRVGSRAGFGVQMGNDAIPVSISLEAALDGQIAAQVTSSGNGETELTLSGLPNAIVEYEIHWFETWQSATIPLIPPIGDVIPIEVTYLTNVQTEIANESVVECPNAPQTLQSPTQISPLRTQAAPTTTPISALTCLSFNDLSALGNVLQVLESPPGVLAGAQIAFAQNWSAPSGWVIHRNSQQVQSVVAGDVASVWSPDGCRPLRGQAIAQSLCPIGVPRTQINSWNIGFAEVATVQSLIDEFDEARQGDLGAYSTGTVIPAGVVVATNFDERDANAWREYPVRPIVHSGSWGLFETLGEYTAPNAGACRYID